VQLPEDQPISVVFALMVPLMPQSAFATNGAMPASAPANAAAIARFLGSTLLRFMFAPNEGIEGHYVRTEAIFKD